MISRRTMLRQSATFALATAALGKGFHATAQGEKVLAYVGANTSPVDAGANGKGIYLYEMDRITGELKLIKLAAQTKNPSWITINAKRNYLYTINESATFDDKSGGVSSFAIDRTTGDLKPLNVARSEGGGPAHMSIDGSGKYVLVANYGGGSVAVLPIQEDGSLGKATDIKADKGSVGSTTPSSAVPGSFAFSGHERPHVHMVQASPNNKFVFYTDLGQDRIYVYKFDATTGKLSESGDPTFISLPNGDGPRHFVFHPNGHWFYSLQEESSTIAFFQFDPETGKLVSKQTISSMTPGFKGTSFASELLISSNGKFIYAANRLHDTVGVFSVKNDGQLSYVSETHTGGDYPRQMSFSPEGHFLYVCNQRSDDISCLKVDKKTGKLTLTNQYTAAGTPSCITFL